MSALMTIQGVGSLEGSLYFDSAARYRKGAGDIARRYSISFEYEVKGMFYTATGVVIGSIERRTELTEHLAA